MDATTIQLSTQKIALYQTKLSGPAILFIHGNSCSGRTFQNQFSSFLGEKYRLVAIDLPGHGHSNPASDNLSYSIPGYAKIVAELTKVIELQEVVLVGWSLGGHIALEIHEMIGGLKGIMIYGAPPLNYPLEIEKLFLPNDAFPYFVAPSLTIKEATIFASTFCSSHYSPDLSSFVKDILNTHGAARVALGNSFVSGNHRDEVQLVANLKVPLAILHGADDRLVNAAYFSSLAIPTLWRKNCQKLNDVGHAIHWEAPTVFNELLDNFIEDCWAEET